MSAYNFVLLYRELYNSENHRGLMSRLHVTFVLVLINALTMKISMSTIFIVFEVCIELHL